MNSSISNNPDGRPVTLKNRMRTTLYFEAETLEQIDAIAGNMRRSEWIREAVQEKLEREFPPHSP